jgi:flagellar biosynthesis GTPase FlhF
MNYLKLALSTFALLGLVATHSVADNHGGKKDSTNVTVETVQKETKELLDTLANYTVEQRDEAAKETKEALKRIDKRTDALEKDIEKDWEQMNDTAQKEAREALKELRQQRIALAEQYGSFKTSSDQAWERMKNGFSDAYSTLVSSWEKAQKAFASK